jgi:hypothetical protein
VAEAAIPYASSLATLRRLLQETEARGSLAEGGAALPLNSRFIKEEEDDTLVSNACAVP